MIYSLIVTTDFPYIDFNTLPPKQQSKKPRTHTFNMDILDIMNEAILNTSSN